MLFLALQSVSTSIRCLVYLDWKLFGVGAVSRYTSLLHLTQRGPVHRWGYANVKTNQDTCWLLTLFHIFWE